MRTIKRLLAAIQKQFYQHVQYQHFVPGGSVKVKASEFVCEQHGISSPEKAGKNCLNILSLPSFWMRVSWLFRETVFSREGL